jgi:hypothetical protein
MATSVPYNSNRAVIWRFSEKVEARDLELFIVLTLDVIDTSTSTDPNTHAYYQKHEFGVVGLLQDHRQLV